MLNLSFGYYPVRVGLRKKLGPLRLELMFRVSTIEDYLTRISLPSTFIRSYSKVWCITSVTLNILATKHPSLKSGYVDSQGIEAKRYTVTGHSET